MKYLLLAAIVAFAWFLWNHNRRAGTLRGRSGKPGPRRVAGPQEMVRCPVCAVHLPRAEALPGPDGALYCSAEHRGRGAGR